MGWCSGTSKKFKTIERSMVTISTWFVMQDSLDDIDDANPRFLYLQ